jgi:hypothetical protein
MFRPLVVIIRTQTNIMKELLSFNIFNHHKSLKLFYNNNLCPITTYVKYFPYNVDLPSDEWSGISQSI